MSISISMQQRVMLNIATVVHHSRRCLDTLPATWLTSAASSATPVQEDCARLTLVRLRFSSVGRAPTSATESSVQLDLESATILCRRTSYSRICHTALSDSRVFIWSVGPQRSV